MKTEQNAKSRVWNKQSNVYRQSLSSDSFLRWPGKPARSESESHRTVKELTNTSVTNSKQLCFFSVIPLRANGFVNECCTSTCYFLYLY